jgi:hypothetical protein
MNVRAIQDVMNSQTVEYIFPFSSKFTFHTDLSMIVVSEGRKSTLFQVTLDVGTLLVITDLTHACRLALISTFDALLLLLACTNQKMRLMRLQRRKWQSIAHTLLHAKR